MPVVGAEVVGEGSDCSDDSVGSLPPDADGTAGSAADDAGEVGIETVVTIDVRAPDPAGSDAMGSDPAERDEACDTEGAGSDAPTSAEAWTDTAAAGRAVVSRGDGPGAGDVSPGILDGSVGRDGAAVDFG